MESELFRLLANPTNQQILIRLNKSSATVTQIYLDLNLNRRESVFKALEKMRKNNLVKRKYSEKISGYKYSVAFSKIIITKNLVLQKYN
jgi:DNA-binding transcriptional ArsR family regulator